MAKTITAELDGAGKKLESLEQRRVRLLQQEAQLKKQLAALGRETRETQRKLETKGKILIGSFLIEAAIHDDGVHGFLKAQLPRFLARSEKPRPADEKAAQHWLDYISEKRAEKAADQPAQHAG